MGPDFKIDFIGIGTPKSATSWIFRCLCEHPQICGSSVKEVGFFYRDRYYNKGISFYKVFFNNCDADKIIGEFTPQYLASREVPGRIKQCFPDIKLIVCLRDPIDRAYSHYWFSRYKNRLRSSLYDSFGEAIRKHPSLLNHGFYYHHLTHWLKYFPRDNIKILIYEDISRNPLVFIQGIYEFLRVRGDFEPTTSHERLNAADSLYEKKDKIPLIRPTLLYVREFLRHTPLDKATHDLNNKLGLQEGITNFLIKNVVVKNNVVPQKPPIKPEDKIFLKKIYAEDVAKLKVFLSRELSSWNNFN